MVDFFHVGNVTILYSCSSGVFYGLQGVSRFVARSGDLIVTSLHVDKKLMVCLIFFRQKKDKQEASWSDINRNGLHSLEESLDLEDNSIAV